MSPTKFNISKKFEIINKKFQIERKLSFLHYIRITNLFWNKFKLEKLTYKQL